MIRKITIENFQSHKHTELEFSPGVNVITGDTDSGKSAVMRALRWVNYNDPTGDEFRSKWGGETRVTQELWDGNIVTRFKDKQNLYKLNDTEYKSFGVDIPPEVKALLNMNSVNLQEQHDSIFLISETSGEVARYFNRLANIDRLDLAEKEISREYSKTKQTVEINKADLESKKKTLEGYSYLEEAEKAVNEIEKLQRQAKRYSKSKKKIKSILADFEEVQRELSGIPELNFEKEIDELLGLHNINDTIHSEESELQMLIDQIKEIKDSLQHEEALTDLDSMIDEILDLYSKSEKTFKNQRKLSELIKDISDVRKSQENDLNELEQLEIKFEKHMIVCPLCNTKLKKKNGKSDG